MSEREKKKILEDWNAYCDEIQQLTPVSTQWLNETKKQKQARIKNLLGNYEKFAQYYFPHVTRGTPCADFHIKAANRILKNKNLFALFEWARAHAKSSTITLIVVIWLLVQDEFKMCLIISKSQDAAIRLLGKIAANLENNKRLISDFGEFKSIGNWADGDFTTKQGVNFVAFGREQSPRGLSSKQSYRPDLIIPDDLDDDELVENPDRVNRAFQWLMSAVYGAMDMGKGRFLYVGNRIGKNSILALIAKVKGVFHLKVNALKKDGSVSWWQKWNVEEIKAVIEKMGYALSQKELFNNPVTEGKMFKREWWQWAKMPKPSTLDALVAYIDPSWTANKKSDHKAVGYIGYKAGDIGRFYCYKVFYRQESIPTMVNWLYDTANQYPDCSVFKMEANFMQGELLSEFDEVGKERKWWVPITGDYRSKPKKEARIQALAAYFSRYQWFFNEKEKDNPDMTKAYEHTMAYDIGARVPDDFLDMLEGAQAIIKGIVISEGSSGWVVGERSLTKDDY